MAAIGPEIIPKKLAEAVKADIAVRGGKVTNIREYIDTQALARASEMDASPRP
jgi:ketosteroid isomerase-like protein